MFAFLQVERSIHGRWLYSVWALLDSEVLRNCHAIIEIKTIDGKVFAGKLPILSLISSKYSNGAGSGQILILFDEQLRQSGGARQNKIFDFKITLVTTEAFRDHLNDGPIKSPHEEFMNTIVTDPSSNCVLINKDPVEPIQPDISLAESNTIDGPFQVVNDGQVGMSIANEEEVITTALTDLGDVDDIIQALIEDPDFETSRSEDLAIRPSDHADTEDEEDEGVPDLVEDISDAENQDQETN